MSTLFVVDVEADGPCAPLYSMVSFGVVRIQDGELDCSFYGQVAPISDLFIPSALAVSKATREQHLGYPSPETTLPRFVAWLAENSAGEPKFVSDNPAFDWSFMNYYLHRYTGGNPFGHSARRIGDFYAGLNRNFRASQVGWRKLKRTRHSHHPVDDARGNAEALIALNKQYNLNVPLFGQH